LLSLPPQPATASASALAIAAVARQCAASLIV
jgi:hypothetical protein